MTASACAKIILCGEHAVVYGQPAIAIPVSALRVSVTNSPADRLVFSLEDTGLKLVGLSMDTAITHIARLTLAALDAPEPPVALHITSDIPVASGLGSGAAVSAAVARSLCEVTGKTISLETLNKLVYEVEKGHHGTPSGIDNTVIVYERPLYFVRDTEMRFLNVASSLHFLIADTGIAAPTRIAVGDVKRLYEQSPAQTQQTITAIGALVQQVDQLLSTGDAAAIGSLMTHNHRLLQSLTVSSPELDRLVLAALDAGALGAKLSGGGRGGNMLALVTPDTTDAVRLALLKAGAVRVYETALKPGDLL